MTHVEDVRHMPYPHEIITGLDKTTLVLAVRALNRANQPSFLPQGTVVDNDPILRKYYLMSRSVIAVAFDLGELSALRRSIDFGGDEPSQWILVGQTDVLGSSAGDLAALINRTPDCLSADLLVPVSRFDGGWRTQPAWVAIKNPVDGDARALYNWVRPSFRWLRTERADGSTPTKTIVTARHMHQYPVKSMDRIFSDAQNLAA